MLIINATPAEMSMYVESIYANPNLNLMLKDGSKSPVSPTISLNSSYLNFFERALEILRANTEFHTRYTFHEIVYVDTTKVHHVVINKTKATAHLFKLFDILGVVVHVLDYSIDDGYKNMYLPNALLRKIEVMNNSQQLQVVMYLVSLLHFIRYLANSVSKTQFLQTEFGKMNLQEEFLATIPEAIYHFDSTNLNLTLSETKMSGISSVQYFNNEYSADLVIGSTVNTGNYMFLTHVPAKAPGKLYHWMLLRRKERVYYLVQLETQTIYTTGDIVTYDLEADGMLTALAAPFKGRVKIIRQDISKSKTSFNYVGSSDEEAITELLEYRDSLATYRGIEEASDLAPYRTELGAIITFPKALALTDFKDYYKDDAYAQELYKMVKAYYTEFDLKELRLLLPSFSKGSTYSMMFYGASGTGKSTAARVIPTLLGMPYVVINFSVNLEESDLIGTMIPNVERKEASEPEFIWNDGILTKAVRNGYVLILEELNLARPGVLGKLNSLLDETRQIDLMQGEIVQAHPNFRIIATGNIAYEGTNRLNKALVNRFEVIHEFVEPNTGELEKIIISRTGYTNSAKIKPVLDTYIAIKKYSDEQTLDLVVSVRQLLNIFRQGRFYSSAETAILDMLVNTAFIEEAEHKENFIKTVLPAINLKFKI